MTNRQLSQMIHEVRYWIDRKEDFSVYAYVYNKGQIYQEDGYRYKLVTVYTIDIAHLFVRVEYGHTIPFRI
jgi:hypothetical protein